MCLKQETACWHTLQKFRMHSRSNNKTNDSIYLSDL